MTVRQGYVVNSCPQRTPPSPTRAPHTWLTVAEARYTLATPVAGVQAVGLRLIKALLGAEPILAAQRGDVAGLDSAV